MNNRMDFGPSARLGAIAGAGVALVLVVAALFKYETKTNRARKRALFVSLLPHARRGRAGWKDGLVFSRRRTKSINSGSSFSKKTQ